ncbi:MAG: hypothetical protein LQ342_002133 [Letrouitia transgressa]|nr:MAG: hypothetical protein LQ342_002133 [Letrouitia transgressa]
MLSQHKIRLLYQASPKYAGAGAIDPTWVGNSQAQVQSPFPSTGEQLLGQKSLQLDLLRQLEQPKESVAIHAQRNLAKSIQRKKRAQERRALLRTRYRLINLGEEWASDWHRAFSLIDGNYQNGNPVPDIVPQEQVIWGEFKNVRAEEIPRPAVWTQSSFLLYVRNLAYSFVPMKVQKEIYNGGEEHYLNVAVALERLFYNDDLKKYMSVASFDEGLKFFCRHRMLYRAGRLFNHMQILGVASHPSTYEIMLRAAALSKDLHNFTFHLDAMISHGVMPTQFAWVNLLRTLEDGKVRLHIVEKMHKRNLIQNKDIAKEVASIVARDKLVIHLNAGREPQTFFTNMDAEFGSGWLSGYTGAIILEEVGSRRSIADAFEMLQVITDYGTNGDERMLIRLLNLCRQTENHALALELVSLFELDYGVRPTIRTMNILFQQAWASRHYNFVKALWQYSCLSGLLHKGMVKKVKESLLSTKALEPTRGMLWKESAGKVITGFGPANTMRRFRTLIGYWQAAPHHIPSRKEFAGLANFVLGESINSKGPYMLQRNLIDILKEALALDRRWIQGHVLREVPIQCKYAQAFSIEDEVIDRGHGSRGGPESEAQRAQNRRCKMGPELRTRPCQCPPEKFIRLELNPTTEPSSPAPAKLFDWETAEANPEQAQVV